MEAGHLYIYTEPIRGTSPAHFSNLTTIREVNLKKFFGIRDPEVNHAGHYNFIALCNGEDYQVRII